MKRLLSWLLGIQIVGMLLAAIAATIEIESILISGSLLTVTGILIATLGYRGDFELAFYYGLAVLGIAVLCFAIIFGFQWGPADAEAPVALLLFLSAFGAAPLGLLAWWELQRAAWRKRPLGAQWGITGLLQLIIVASVAFGLFQSLGSAGAAAAAFLAYLLIVSGAAASFHANRPASGK